MVGAAVKRWMVVFAVADQRVVIEAPNAEIAERKAREHVRQRLKRGRVKTRIAETRPMAPAD